MLAHQLVGLKGRDHFTFPFAFVVAHDFHAVVAVALVTFVGAGLAIGQKAVPGRGMGIGELDHFERGDLSCAHAVQRFAHLHLAAAQQAIGGVVVHRPFVPVVGLVAHPNVVDGALHMVAISVPRQGHGLHQSVELLFTGAGTGLGKAVEQSLISHSDHAGVHRVVAVVVAVFFAVQTQDVIEPEFGPQHGCHAPWDDAGALRADQAEVFTRHTAQVPGVVQGAGQKAFVLAQPLL